MERLEARIVELASQIAGATCELLVLVGDFDAAEGWRGWEMRSTADWLSWKCGVGLAAAREQVRVARALRHFPKLVETFAAGRLSYSKVRAITRIASEENLEELIGWGLSNPAAELERLVAAHRRLNRQQVRARQAARSISYRWAEDGSLVGSFRLPPEQAAVFLAALQAAQQSLAEPVAEVIEAEDAATECPDCRTEATRIHGDCDGSAIAHRKWRHLDVSAETLSCEQLVRHHARRMCTRSGENERRAMRAGRRGADALARVSELALSGLERAGHSDETDNAGGLPGLGSDRYLLLLHAPAHVSAETSDASPPEMTVRDGFGGDIPLPTATLERLGCDCDYQISTDDRARNPLHLGRRTRRIRSRLALAVHARDRGRCRAPGCHRNSTQIHHIIHWRHGGPTCIENLISLCDGHHWLAHEGGWTITVAVPGCWVFTRADGVVVPHLGAPPLHVAPLPHNPDIELDAITPTWNGDRDIGGAVEILGQLARQSA
jgi:hypothetical protein